MSLVVEQPGARTDSIPDGPAAEGPRARRLSYRPPSSSWSSWSPSRPSRPSPPRLDDAAAASCDCDCGTDKASPNLKTPVAQPRPRPGRHAKNDDDNDDNDDDMLSVARTDSSGDLAAPALPAKSALRTSRLLASLSQKAVEEQHRPILPHAAPHQIYLSSEEDASSSADDLSDLDELDSHSERSHWSSASRTSNEDTARIVTVVFHGRPSIVDLPPRGSTDPRRPATGILRTATEPTLTRTRSASSSSSAAATPLHPPRSSSMMPSGFHLRRPQFLAIDPQMARQGPAKNVEQDATRTPKTPSTMLKKTLNLVKKRSRPVLNATESFPLIVSPMEQVGEEPEPQPQPQPQSQPASPMHRTSTSYQSMLRTARRSVEPGVTSPTVGTDAPSPTSSHRSRFRSGLSISRPRSIRT